MRILAVIIIAPHMEVSGAVNAGIRLTKEISRDCDIDLAIMSDKDDFISQGKISTYFFKSSNVLSWTTSFLPNKFRTLLYRSRIPKFIKENHTAYDLVHFHNPVPALELMRCSNICQTLKIPYVITSHGFFELLEENNSYRLSRFYEKLAFKFLMRLPLVHVIEGAHKILSLSPQEIPLLRKYNIPEEKIVVIPNGVDRNLKASEAAIKKVITKYELSSFINEEIPICFFLGNHTANKGLDILFETFNQLDINFLLIVGGKKRDEVDYSFRNKSSMNKLIITDFIPDEEVQAIMSLATLFVYFTRGDTLPLVILEAMTNGLPIIASNIGGIPYLLSKDSGLIVENLEPQYLSIEIKNLLSNKERMATLSNNALERVKEEFSWNASAQKVINVYRSIIENIKNYE